jgi:hypothetical protein
MTARVSSVIILDALFSAMFFLDTIHGCSFVIGHES